MTVIAFHIQPRASKTEIVGHHGDAIKVRIKSPPVDGTANQELIEFLSRVTGVPKGDIAIVSGATGRRKRITIGDLSRAEVEKRLGIGRE